MGAPSSCVRAGGSTSGDRLRCAGGRPGARLIRSCTNARPDRVARFAPLRRGVSMGVGLSLTLWCRGPTRRPFTAKIEGSNPSRVAPPLAFFLPPRGAAHSRGPACPLGGCAPCPTTGRRPIPVRRDVVRAGSYSHRLVPLGHVGTPRTGLRSSSAVCPTLYRPAQARLPGT